MVEGPTPHEKCSLLLLGNTHGLTAATGRASVLTTDAEAVSVTHTTVSADLLQALKIVTEADINGVAAHVLGLAALGAALTVQEPLGDLVLGGVGDDVGDLLKLFNGEGASAALDVDARLLADHVGEADTDTLDHAEREGDLAATIDVGVQQTHQVLEAVGEEGQGHS